METVKILRNSSVVIVVTVAVIMWCGSVASAEQMQFRFTGHVNLDQTLGMDCTPFDAALLYFPFILNFDLLSDTPPDEISYYGDSIYYLSGNRVEFFVGNKPYPLSELTFVIGLDYIGIFMEEYSGFMLEYIWANMGLFSDGALINICDIPGAVRVKPEHRLWADFNCWGPVVSAEISIQCGMPWVEKPLPQE